MSYVEGKHNMSYIRYVQIVQLERVNEGWQATAMTESSNNAAKLCNVGKKEEGDTLLTDTRRCSSSDTERVNQDRDGTGTGTRNPIYD